MPERVLSLRSSLLAVSTLLCLSASDAALANYTRGYDAYQQGDMTTAIRQWNRAAEAGDTKAMLALGVMFESGIGTLRDYRQAEAWYRFAQSRGDKDAETYLRRLEQRYELSGPVEEREKVKPSKQSTRPQDRPFDKQTVASRREPTSYYLGVMAGLSFSGGGSLKDEVGNEFETDYDLGTSFQAVLGRKFEGQYRVELGISRRNNDLSEIRMSGLSTDTPADVKVTAITLNGYYDFDATDRLDVYFGGGFGFGFIDFESGAGSALIINDDDTAFAWHLGVGFAYKLNRWIDLTFGYSYFDLLRTDLESSAGGVTGTSAVDFDSNEVRGGVRVHF